MSGWSNGIVDLDNDGWKDLVVARSNVLDNIEQISRHFRYAEPNSVFRNLGNGQFEDVSATAGADFTRPAPHRGLAYGDLDNDGRMDLVVTALGAPVSVFRNVTETHNHWILLKLVGTKSNRMGIGAQIRVTTDDGRKLYNEATTSTGYAASSDPRVHFGLGSFARDQGNRDPLAIGNPPVVARCDCGSHTRSDRAPRWQPAMNAAKVESYPDWIHHEAIA